jgi:L,D-transpeptidase-like protein
MEVLEMAGLIGVNWLVAARKALICAIAFASALIVESSSVAANVLISVNKNTQQMSVSINGVPRYEFSVSTGRAGYGTPNGTYRPQWMAKSWFSKEYYNSPMPHSIFFHRGYAIHGSYEINRLGGPASHGCIRLHPENAETLFAVVQREGMPATKIVVYGNNPTIVQRRAPLAQPSYEDQPATRIQPHPWFFPPFRTPFDTFDPGRVY